MAGMGDVIARLAVSLSLDASEFATGSTKAQRDMGRLRDTFAKLGEKWTQTGKRLSIGVTAPLTAFGVASAKAASDAQELDSAFTETFDNLSGAMRDWAEETGDAMGRSTQSMQEMANTFGIFFNQAAPTRKEAAEMSKTFTVLAQDLSSFYNVSGDIALQKLRSGLSGESEPLRDFGVFLTEATVKAKAMEMGLTGLGDELTEQEKILARYQLILESTMDAQGDVARTSGGAANQWRSFTEALQELQVVIGERLLPVLTPLIRGVTSLVNGFNNLPSGVQTAIVAFGAVAASIGPMMLIMGTLAATVLPLFAAKFGVVGLAISAFVNPLGTAISLLASFVAQLGGMAILKTIGGLLLRFAGPLGLIASAGLLIYNNWDKIVEVFSDFAAKAREAIGPPMQELIATITGALDELWGGPLGDGIRTAMAAISEFAGIVGSAIGQQVINVLKAVLEIALGVFKQIGNGITLINAILTGDWAGAWEAAKNIVTIAVDSVWRAFSALAPQVVASMRNLYVGVKTWLQDKLGGVFSWVQEKVEAVESTFAWLYNEVVGNSWIPDMVEEVGQHMNKLQSLMVDPATKATKDTEAAFRDLAREVGSILDRLFPKVAALNAMKDDIATIEAGVKAGIISGDVGEEARRRARREAAGLNPEGPDVAVSEDLLNTPSLVEGMGKIGDGLKGLGDKAKVQTVRIAETFKDMAESTLAAVDRMANAIKGGGFLDILSGVVGLGIQLGSIGAFGKSIQANINKGIPGYATGTRNHPGGLAIVGERGPELVSMPRGSSVFTNSESRAMMGGRGGNTYNFSGNLMTPEFWERINAGDIAAAQGGAQISAQQSRFAASRRLGR